MTMQSLLRLLGFSRHHRNVLRMIGMDAAQEAQPLPLWAVAATMVVSYLEHTDLERTGGIGVLVSRIREYLERFDEAISSGDEEIPTYFLGVADNKYVTWGDANSWFEISTEAMLDRIPRPPKMTVMWNIVAHYTELKVAYESLINAEPDKTDRPKSDAS